MTNTLFTIRRVEKKLQKIVRGKGNVWRTEVSWEVLRDGFPVAVYNKLRLAQRALMDIRAREA